MRITFKRLAAFLTIASIFLISVGVSRSESTNKKFAKEIQGAWLATDTEDTVTFTETTMVRRWKVPAGFILPLISTTTGEEIACKKESNGNSYCTDTYSYILNPDTTPMAIDLKETDTKGKKYLNKGVFNLQPDRLTICYAIRGADRPKGFAKGQSDCLLLVLKREKKQK